MRYLLSMLVACFLFAEQDVSHLAVTEALPETLIDGCVSVVTGALYYQHSSITVQGAKPLHIPINYISSLGKHSTGGWHSSPHLMATQRGQKIFVHEPNGTRLLYYYPHSLRGHRRDYHFKLADNYKEQALTNCSRGTISARHDLANQYVILKDDQKSFQLYCSDGTVRYYVRRGRIGQFEDAFLLHWEKKPDGNKILYEYHVDYHSNQATQKYKFHYELQWVKSVNPSETQTYAWIHFNYLKDPKQLADVEITTSDQQKFTLLYNQLKHTRKSLFDHMPHICNEPVLYTHYNRRNHQYLRYLYGWNHPNLSFVYHTDKYHHDPLLY